MADEAQVNELITADCYAVTAMPGLNRLFVDFCAGTLPDFLPSPGKWQEQPPVAGHRQELVRLLALQNPQASTAPALAALASGAGTVLTGQQVGLFGGPLYTPYKAATAIARARTATAEGKSHVAIFWLASEDHDFTEVSHTAFPTGRELRQFTYDRAPAAAVAAGHVILDETITLLVESAVELMGQSEATDALVAAYRPGKTFAQAFAEFYARIFAGQGLLVVDASGREFHRLGSPVLKAALERADELHAALAERSKALEDAGYHAQVNVAEQSSLLFLFDEKTGARQALKRTVPNAAEPDGLWHAGAERFATAELVALLEAAPERFSPAALLRPLFQDFLFSSSAQVAGPAEIAYLAQSAVLFERILGRQTPVMARFSATLIEPTIGNLLRKHGLGLEQVFAENVTELAQRLAARSMPPETKRRLAAAGNAMDAELTALVDWMQTQDKGLGQSADTAAGKIRYQMNRLRTLAANFQLQRESTLTRHAETIAQAIYPGGVLQERVHGAAYYFARYGLELAATISEQAANLCPGHSAIWL
jgi:bacillithiol biosynthesis cysteine-adding enzyme BshC